MIHSTKKKVLAVIAAAVIALSATSLMSGCGCGSSGDNKATTAPATTVQPTTKAAASSSADGSSANDNDDSNSVSQDINEQSSSSDDQGGNSGNDDNGGVEKHGNITREEAGSIALSRVPYGQTVTIVQAGNYNGQDCWVVGIADTTGKIYQCYVTSVICEYSMVSPNENPDLDSDASHAESSNNSVDAN